MFDIKCKRSGCKFNKNLNCSVKILSVKSDTGCKSYQPSNESPKKEVDNVSQPPIRKDIKVNCDAKCLFNKDHICLANGITVQTCANVSCPNCCTFTAK